MMNSIKVLIAMLMGTLLFPGCTRDDTDTPIRSGGVGEKVMVTLEVHIPKAESPVIKPITGEKANRQFTVCAEAAPNTRSDGTSKLYNLWLFQFDAAGNINGLPYKISDEVTAVNDMVLLDVPLVVAKDQTLYLLALGRQIDADLNTIRTFSEVEALSFSYTVAKDGVVRSKITSDDDMPFVGYIKGATVVSVETGENRGQVEYNTPDGFAGGIGIRRLMSRITLKYKFEVSGYVLDGLRLTNANSIIRITNPDKNVDTDTYITIEGEKSATPDTDGFYTITWFVAQNQQGTVEAIATEGDRYNKQLENGSYEGNAPQKATNIEAWAYSTKNSDYYAIYQMYVGKNNTSNFDVTANTQYNLRTTINTDIESAKNDGRIRSFTASQSIFLRASGYLSGATGGTGQVANATYDLDAHCDKRPLIIYTKGRIATVGIYTDEACSHMADSKTSWLRLSSSDNYTDAYNNNTQPLGTYIKTDIIQLPTKLIFYLYSDEYFGENGEIPENYENRRLYIKVETTTDGVAEGAIKRNSVTYYFDQRPAIPMGRLGGEFKNGEYTEDLYLDQITEYSRIYDEKGTSVSYLPQGYGYVAIDRDSRYNGVLDAMNGRSATIQMAENPGELQVNKASSGTTTLNFANPIRQNGHVMLYQYTAQNTYAARYCYDRNRDENGNGYLDDNEIKWYVPAIYQLYGFSATNPGLSLNCSASSYVTNSFPSMTLDTGSQGYANAASGATIRCVRNVTPKPGAPKQARFYVHTEGSAKYGAIDASGMPNAENRAENPNFYVQVPLCSYSETGQESVIQYDDKGDTIFVKRVRRHGHYVSLAKPTLNSTVSSHFLIAPTYIDMDGNPCNVKVPSSGAEPGRISWANAMGYLASANTTGPDIEQYAVAKGCALYRGKDGTDDPGSWRLPTQREMMLVSIFMDSFNNVAAETGSFVFYKPNSNGYADVDAAYWTATENPQASSPTSSNGLYAWHHKPFNPAKSYGSMGGDHYGGDKHKYPQLVRCIRDLPPVK